MMKLPIEAEKLIATHRLRTPKKIYKPNTVGSIIGGLFILAFAGVWIAVALLLTGSPLLPGDQLPTLFPPFPVSMDSPLTTIMPLLGIVFPLIGLIVVGVGLANIISALRNRQVRAVLCEYGVVHLARDGADAFRWEQVAAVLDKVDVHTSKTTNNVSGITHTSTTASHTYTVACKDGRRFIFNPLLGKSEQLGEEIQIAVALAQTSASARELKEQ